jgi:CelD/BcsL family acetyltransferase involved in cellulose biosynthesis
MNGTRDLTSVEAEWRAIHDANHSASFFSGFDYVSLWCTSFARSEDIRIYPVVKGGRTIGFLPLIRETRGPVRLLSSLVNEHASHPAPLVAAGAEDDFRGAWFESLAADRASWDILHCWSYSFDRLVAPPGAPFAAKEGAKPTYSIAVKGSFDEYFKALSQKFRRTTRGEWNKLARLPSACYRRHDNDEAVALWPEFLEIEDSGWKAREGSSIRRIPANYRTYYDRLIRLLAAEGVLSLHFLEIDGVRIAGSFGYQDRDTLHIAKAGYREEHGGMSPSNLLAFHVFKETMETRPDVRRIHLFPGDFGYKHRYINEETSYTELTVYNRNLLGTAARIRSAWKARLKGGPARPEEAGTARAENEAPSIPAQAECSARSA